MSHLCIVMPRNARRAQRHLSQNRRWTFLGTRSSARRTAELVLGSAQLHDPGADLSAVSLELKQPFLDWIAALGANQPSALRWWSSTFASRSPLQSDFFLSLCYLHLIHGWAACECPIAVVVVDDPWLWLQLRDVRDAADFVMPGPGPWLAMIAQRIAGWAKRPVCVGYAASWLALAKLTLRFLSPNSLQDPCALPPHSVLVHGWVEPRSFATDNRFHNAILGGLDSIAGAQGQPVITLTPLVVPIRSLKLLATVETPVLISTASLRWRDFAAALTNGFRIEGAPPPFDGRGTNRLLQRELLRERAHPAGLFYRLGFRAYRQIARATRSRISAVVYPFENQPWEKMLCLAWREAAPEVTLVGYQHAAVPTLFLHYFLGRGESEHMPLPDWIAANGTLSLERLAHGGIPFSRLRMVGALRYQYLHVPAPSPAPPPPRLRRTVLVAFPLAYAAARFFLLDLIEAFASPLQTEEGPPVRLLLKFHPLLPLQRLRPPARPLPAGMSVATGGLAQSLAAADLFLYMPPTTAAWEALFHGVPVLKYRTCLLDLDAMTGVFDAPICERNTLRCSVTRHLRALRPAAPAAELLPSVFSPVREQAWAELLRSA